MEYYLVFCPFCLQETKCFIVEHHETVNISKDSLDISCHLLKCLKCHEKFYDGKICLDPIDMAIRQYRKARQWIQSEEITALRRSLNLTQKEFSRQIDIHFSSLYKMENGYLQTEDFEEKMKNFFQETI